MEERSETEKALDEVILPGFRFHPTDEELVGFYLKRKINQRPLSIELIKQLDIYKHDPWDLPKLASTGEKEWYFYCPRDRKYRNSARPNRVTGSGFWKATGTDRPIYSSEGNKCIGLKKSLVFYKGRAAKGQKTDWMMHEFRLPSLTDPNKRSDNKSFPANDSWAICRIFKKTNSTAQRALSQSWVSPLSPEPNTSHLHDHILPKGTNSGQFSSSLIQNSASFSPVDFVSYKPYQNPNLTGVDFFCPSLLFSPLEVESSTSNSGPTKSSVLIDNVTPSMLLNMPSILGESHLFGGLNKTALTSGAMSHQEQYYCGVLPYHDHHAFQGTSLGTVTSSNNFDHQNFMINNKNNLASSETVSDDQSSDHQDQWEAVRSTLGFPFNATLPLSTAVADPWKPSMLWETSPSPTEVSRNFPTTRCFT